MGKGRREVNKQRDKAGGATRQYKRKCAVVTGKERKASYPGGWMGAQEWHFQERLKEQDKPALSVSGTKKPKTDVKERTVSKDKVAGAGQVSA